MSELIVEYPLPALYTGSQDAPFGEVPIVFEPLLRDGRVGAEIHSLYSTSETGAGGPAAAIVRYLPGAESEPHMHPGYEIIFLFSGEIETEDGTYGPNSLIVMPPGSVHAPRSPKGAVGLAVWEKPVQPAS